MKRCVFEQAEDLYELTTDGRTVWVNGPDAMCLGRVTISRMDVHGTTVQQQAGKHCLDCRSFTKGTPWEAWMTFVRAMHRQHGILLPEDFMKGVWSNDG